MTHMRVLGVSLLAAWVLAWTGSAYAQPRVKRAPPAPRAEAAPAAPPVQVEVVTVVPTMTGMVVLLKTLEGERYLPIWIGPAEALAIQLRLAHEERPRPLTHDLLDSVIAALNARITRVVVADLRDGVFIGQVDVRAGRREHHIDARSSDSIALAIGASVPIYVAKHVMDRAGLDRATLERDGYQGAPIPVEGRHSL